MIQAVVHSHDAIKSSLLCFVDPRRPAGGVAASKGFGRLGGSPPDPTATFRGS
jgi:hypothetical protein